MPAYNSIFGNQYYGSGIALLSSIGAYQLITVIANIQSNITFKQYNTLIQSNNGTLSSKTSGWRPYITLKLINTINSYDNLVLIMDIINGYYADTSKKLMLFPRINNFIGYECQLQSDFDVFDLTQRLEQGQEVDLTFIGKQLVDLPYNI